MKELREALEFLEGARFENYRGQIIAHHDNKNKDFIVFDLTCVCSEVGSRNAEEMGDALCALLNGAKEALEQRDAFLTACEALMGERPETENFMVWLDARQQQILAAIAKARGTNAAEQE